MKKAKLKTKLILLLILVVILVCYLQFKQNTNKEADRQKNNLVNENQKRKLAENQKLKLDENQLTTDLNELLASSFFGDELDYLSLSINIPQFNYQFDFNEQAEYLNASIIKVPLNMYIYDLAKQNPDILSQELVYFDYYYEEGSGIMQDVETATVFDVQSLLTNSIRYSDNIATNMLIDAFISDITKCSELIPYFGNANYEMWTSNSQNKMQVLTYLYANQRQYQTLIKDMKASIYRDRIPYYLPENVEVAVKTGDIESTSHDIAIVFDNQSVDYLITISMDSITDSDLRMATLSKAIYASIQENIQRSN